MIQYAMEFLSGGYFIHNAPWEATDDYGPGSQYDNVIASHGCVHTPLATMAWAYGIRGFVCSPVEVAHLRRQLGQEPLLVIPGIRPEGSAIGDQRRIATPAAAMAAGASYLVVGRPITRAVNPGAAARAILAEMRTAIGLASA